MRVALAWHGPVMIELIEPEPGRTGIYADVLPEDGGIALHHLGYGVAEERVSTLARDLCAAGTAVPVAKDNPGLALLYADTRSIICHLSEFAMLGEDGRRVVDSVPGGSAVLAYWRR